MRPKTPDRGNAICSSNRLLCQGLRRFRHRFLFCWLHLSRFLERNRQSPTGTAQMSAPIRTRELLCYLLLHEVSGIRYVVPPKIGQALLPAVNA